LIGVNQYRDVPLYGCVTDVELQRELLIHRFGFQPADVLTLLDQQATREGIETAFVNHLTQQARAGDVVVFHFSGYGSQGTAGESPESLQSTLVSWDEPIQNGDTLMLNEVPETTLWAMARSLRTDKIATILDASYTYSGKPLLGNLRIRTHPRSLPAQLNPAELEFQAKLLGQTGVPSPSTPFPGILLTAARTGQLATETHWNGITAGLFTAALTQQLWQASQPTTVRVWLNRTTEQVEQLGNQEQQPELTGQKSQEATLSPYYLPAKPVFGADGVVTAVEETGKVARLWLGGLPAPLLEQYSVSSLLQVVPESASVASSNNPIQLQLTSREGLIARAKLCCTPETPEDEPLLQVGQFVREQVRVLPHNIGLTVALDSCLGRIERVDAISTLTAVPHLSSAIAGEQAADYLFSKTRDALPTQVATLPSAPLPQIVANGSTGQGGYGLFSAGRDPIPNTVGEKGEAIKVAMRRLVPKLQTLLAAKLLHLTLNEHASHLAVEARLDLLATEPQTLLHRKTLAATSPSLLGKRTALDTAEPVTLVAGSRIQYRLENRSRQPLYYLVLGLTSNRDLLTLYSPPVRSLDAPENSPDQDEEAIAPGATLTLPSPNSPLQWLLRGPAGVAETFLICSCSPFSQTLALLASTLRPQSNAPVLGILPNALDVAQTVLQDLHQASEPVHPSTPADAFALNMNAWATLHFVYHVV
jgi:hypothetical protein